ncbi:MAG: hypothetical protein MAG458_00344 [Nitrosopumilus sp.]|nr:hypothetical protein [Nitrosopumilus sp.]
MFFIYNEKNQNDLKSKDKCEVCSEKIETPFNPMKEWGIEGSICGKCYSKKINEFYPGEHTRVNKHLD